MIPIECPNCGRSGNVPPDRLLARLVCKACHSVFHMDSGGRMVLGEPGDPNAKNKKAQYSQRDPLAELGETWNNVPKAAKFGVPLVLFAVIFYMYFMPEPGAAYEDRATAIVQGLISNNRSKVVGLATKDSSEAAGKWFDLMHGEVDKNQIPSNAFIKPGIWTGKPEDEEMTIFVVLSNAASATAAPVSIYLKLKREGANWSFEGNKTFEDAEKTFKSTKK